MDTKHFTAFGGHRRIVSGELADVATTVKDAIADGASVLVFDDTTGEQVDLDLRRSPAEMREQAAGGSVGPQARRGPGRPKLGVVAREVTLLPRHWDWLNRQPGGASVALRKLVAEAGHANSSRDRVRGGREAAYRFMSAIAGNLPGFEEAARALFAGNREKYDSFTEAWPRDVRDHARKFAHPTFEAPASV